MDVCVGANSWPPYRGTAWEWEEMAVRGKCELQLSLSSCKGGHSCCQIGVRSPAAAGLGLGSHINLFMLLGAVCFCV